MKGCFPSPSCSFEHYCTCSAFHHRDLQEVKSEHSSSLTQVYVLQFRSKESKWACSSFKKIYQVCQNPFDLLVPQIKEIPWNKHSRDKKKPNDNTAFSCHPALQASMGLRQLSLTSLHQLLMVPTFPLTDAVLSFVDRLPSADLALSFWARAERYTCTYCFNSCAFFEPPYQLQNYVI